MAERGAWRGCEAGARDAGRDRGFALLLVLWTLVMLALIVTQLLAAGRSEAKLAGNLREAATAEAAADGAVFEAISHLLDRSARHWAADASTREIRLGAARARIGLISEASKFDLNAMTTDQLAALLRAIGVAPARADELALAIGQWRLPDSDEGAVRRAYQTAGRDYAPTGDPFESVSEVALVLGMTPDIAARLAPHLTIWHAGDPDPRLADALVRDILRTQGGSEIPLAVDPRAGEAVTIDVSVTTDGGARFERHAVVRIGASDDAGAWRILAWR